MRFSSGSYTRLPIPHLAVFHRERNGKNPKASTRGEPIGIEQNVENAVTKEPRTKACVHSRVESSRVECKRKRGMSLAQRGFAGKEEGVE